MIKGGDLGLWLLIIFLLCACLLFGGDAWITENPERLVIGLILISWLSVDAKLKRLEALLLDISIRVPETKPNLEYLDAIESLGVMEREK